jgi:hypothetical protein
MQQQSSKVGGMGWGNLRVGSVNILLSATLGEGGDAMVSRRSLCHGGHPRHDGVHSMVLGIILGWPCHGDRWRGSTTLLGEARLG